MFGFISEKIKSIKSVFQTAKVKISNSISGIVYGNYDDIEEGILETLLESDFGFSLSKQWSKDISNKFLLSKQNNKDSLYADIIKFLQNQSKEILLKRQSDISLKNDILNVIFLVGANGSGKTSLTGKMGNNFIKEGKKVAAVSTDTFRAAAFFQLEKILNKLNICNLQKEGIDKPTAIVYSAIADALEKNFDVLFIDVSGRLENNISLMNELKKTVDISNKFKDINKEVLIVADTSAGHQVVQQIKAFNDFVCATGIVMTKIDGSTKGGSIIAIAHEIDLPIKAISAGESFDDCKTMNPSMISSSLF